MAIGQIMLAVTAGLTILGVLAAPALAQTDGGGVQLGPRPFYLVDRMDKSELQATLRQCADGPFSRTAFSIGHRGAPLQFPEHTQESYEAAARMGAGILECDVTFTKDRRARLPARAVRSAHHDQHPRDPRAGGEVHAAVHAGRPGGRHAGVGEVLHERHHARRVQDAVRQDGRVQPRRHHGRGVPGRHAELAHRPLRHLRHADDPRGEHRAVHEPRRQVHARAQGARASPMPFEGDYTQEDVRAADDRRVQGGRRRSRAHVFAQSFNLDDVLLLDRERAARSASRPCTSTTAYDTAELRSDDPRPVAGMHELAAQGRARSSRRRCGCWSRSTRAADRALGLRRGRQGGGPRHHHLDARALRARSTTGGGYYYQSVADAIDNDGDMLQMLDVLAQQVGDPRHLLRLAGDRDLLRQLHGPRVRLPGAS